MKYFYFLSKQHGGKPYCHTPCYSAMYGPGGKYVIIIILLSFLLAFDVLCRNAADVALLLLYVCAFVRVVVEMYVCHETI